ncbi:MAG: transposase [Gammaproteobacteria bacterium]|nr:transposase [Gammaproteobacteria bacterium]
MMLSHFDLRAGIPLAATIQTQSMGEILVFKQDELAANSWLRVRNAIHVVDRAFIDTRYWNQRFRTYRSTVITRMKSMMTLNQGDVHWRLVGFLCPDGEEYEYLINDLTLEPGVIAFLYHRRWDKEKYYDTFKNDLAGAKAWGKSPIAIEQQALMGIATVLLTRLFLQRRQKDLQLEKPDSTQDRKHQIKQDQTYFSSVGIAYRAFWTQLSKITKQVWRFLKSCFLQEHRLAFYQRQLKPLLLVFDDLKLENCCCGPCW